MSTSLFVGAFKLASAVGLDGYVNVNFKTVHSDVVLRV